MPRQIVYTYALELSADEAEAMGAVGVQLDRPAVLYVENFLGMQVGSAVPAGYYERRRGRWEAGGDGLVVAVVGVDAMGRAELDVDGDGLAEGLAELGLLGIEEGELRELGRLYGRVSSCGAWSWSTLRRGT